MTSHQDVDENVKITDFQDAGLPQQEELDSIMETLEGMESKFKSSFQEIDEAFRDLNIKIDEGNGRFNGLVNEILTNFDDLDGRREPPELRPVIVITVSTHQPPNSPPPPATAKCKIVSTLGQVASLSVFTVCEIRQVTCKAPCYLFGFIGNEARQSLIIIPIKPTSCLCLRRLCTNE